MRVFAIYTNEGRRQPAGERKQAMIGCQLKLELTDAQERRLNQWLWHLEGVWNWGLRKIELDAKDKIYHTEFDLRAMLKGHSVRMGIPFDVMGEVVKVVHRSWERCFKKISRRPRLKGARRPMNSIPFRRPIKRPIGNRINLISIKGLKFHKQTIPEGTIKCGRIVKKASGWYLCLFIDAERRPIERTGNAQVGIDPGFNSLVAVSTGELIEHPREFEAAETRLGQAQRGKNRKLAARLRERIANRVKDRNHKLSLRLVRENQLIAFSADRHKNIAKKFGKSVSSSSHGQLRQMLSYKSLAGGTKYVEVDSKFSTKRCSNCGALSGPSGLRNLAVRRWKCGCGAEHDRDSNAAMNTLNVALGMSVERVA